MLLNSKALKFALLLAFSFFAVARAFATASSDELRTLAEYKYKARIDIFEHFDELRQGLAPQPVSQWIPLLYLYRASVAQEDQFIRTEEMSSRCFAHYELAYRVHAQIVKAAENYTFGGSPEQMTLLQARLYSLQKLATPFYKVTAVDKEQAEMSFFETPQKRTPCFNPQIHVIAENMERTLLENQKQLIQGLVGAPGIQDLLHIISRLRNIELSNRQQDVRDFYKTYALTWATTIAGFGLNAFYTVPRLALYSLATLGATYGAIEGFEIADTVPDVIEYDPWISHLQKTKRFLKNAKDVNSPELYVDALQTQANNYSFLVHLAVLTGGVDAAIQYNKGCLTDLSGCAEREKFHVYKSSNL